MRIVVQVVISDIYKIGLFCKLNLVHLDLVQNHLSLPHNLLSWAALIVPKVLQKSQVEFDSIPLHLSRASAFVADRSIRAVPVYNLFTPVRVLLIYLGEECGLFGRKSVSGLPQTSRVERSGLAPNRCAWCHPFGFAILEIHRWSHSEGLLGIKKSAEAVWDP